jgi:hypothetical protein
MAFDGSLECNANISGRISDCPDCCNGTPEHSAHDGFNPVDRVDSSTGFNSSQRGQNLRASISASGRVPSHGKMFFSMRYMVVSE